MKEEYELARVRMIFIFMGIIIFCVVGIAVLLYIAIKIHPLMLIAPLLGLVVGGILSWLNEKSWRREKEEPMRRK